MIYNNFLKLRDINKKNLFKILRKSYNLKFNIDKTNYKPFLNKSLAMIFEKPSTRTRVSFEIGMYELGGHALYLNSKDIQIDRGEIIEDTARVLSNYVDIVLIRTFEQEIIEKLAKFSTIPIINGLSDKYHPCQILSDIFSIVEYKSKIFNIKKDLFDNSISKLQEKFNKLNFLYIGDSTSNIANSLFDAVSIFGMNAFFVSPEKYSPFLDNFNKIKQITIRNGGNIEFLSRLDDLPKKIFDVIYTDIWASMGKEEEINIRKKIFSNYQVNISLINNYAKDDVIVMHCLPAHRGEEITQEVIESEKSIVFKQAANRLHVQKAIMLYSMNKLNF